MYIPEHDIIDQNESYIAYNARYAQNMIAVHVTDETDGWKSRTSIIIEKFTRRYSHREKSYMMSKAQFGKFKIEFDKKEPLVKSAEEYDETL